jgi:hypothetical protein
MKRFSILALVLGVILDIGGSFVADLMMTIGWAMYHAAHGLSSKTLHSSADLTAQMYQDGPFLTLIFLVNFLFAAMAGALTAWLSPPQGRILNAVILVGLDFLLTLALSWSSPWWATVISCVLSPFAILLGAFVVKLVKADLSPQG